MGLERREHLAHVRLWGAVIKLALRDARRLEEARGRPPLSKWEHLKIERLTKETSPETFFASDWFRQICYMTGSDPSAILYAISKRSN